MHQAIMYGGALAIGALGWVSLTVIDAKCGLGWFTRWKRNLIGMLLCQIIAQLMIYFGH